MKFSAQFITVAVAALAAPAAFAAPTDPGGVNQCNVGELQCCKQVQTASQAAGLLGLLGIVAGVLQGNVGINCTPISVIGVGGNSCSAQPVCCTNNQFNGVVNLGCTPINLNL